MTARKIHITELAAVELVDIIRLYLDKANFPCQWSGFIQSFQHCRSTAKQSTVDCPILHQAVLKLYAQLNKCLYTSTVLCQAIVFLSTECNKVNPWSFVIYHIYEWHPLHYDDVTMSGMASQITSLTIVHSTVYPGADQRNIKAPRHWPLCGEFTGPRWIPRTNGQ